MVPQCPDKRDLYVEEYGSLFLYKHKDDGSKCHYFNRFHVTPTDVLKRFISGDGFAYTPVVVAAMRSCDEVEIQLYEDLQNASNREQAEKLRKIFDYCVEAGDYLLCERLHLVFGPTFMLNMLTVTARPYLPGAYPDLDGKPQYTLHVLGQEYTPLEEASLLSQDMIQEEERKANELHQSILDSRNNKKKRK